MKKHLTSIFSFLTLILVLIIFPAKQVQAQTNVIITSVFDTTTNWKCDLREFFTKGNCQGYAANTDTIKVYVNFGDGNSTIIPCVVTASGTINTFYMNTVYRYASPGTYNITYIATGPNGDADTLIDVNGMQIPSYCNNISGRLYQDINGNCTYDIGLDSFVAYYPVKLYSGNTLIDMNWTDFDGKYGFSQNPGNYTIIVDTSIAYQLSCPNSGLINVNPITNPVNDIGLTCVQTIDFFAKGKVSGLRPNQSGFINMDFGNIGCQVGSSTQVTLQLYPKTSYLSCAFPPSSINGNTLTWNFSSLVNFNNLNLWSNSGHLLIEIQTLSTAVIGDILCFTTSISPLIGDVNPLNNSQTFCDTVVNSYDPNIKVVEPVGEGLTGSIPQNTTFTYTIHFQNTGTDEAYNIVVTDYIQPALDISTLNITGFSHFVAPKYTGNNLMQFIFPSIHLPDSASQPLLSQGWVTYTIKAKPNLPNGTKIKNDADIYFDDNAPIHTNTTLNTIDIFLNADEASEALHYFSFYPNPADKIFSVMSTNKAKITGVSLYNIMGIEVLNTSQIENIPTGNLPSGVYVVKVRTERGDFNGKLQVKN